MTPTGVPLQQSWYTIPNHSQTSCLHIHLLANSDTWSAAALTDTYRAADTTVSTRAFQDALPPEVRSPPQFSFHTEHKRLSHTYSGSGFPTKGFHCYKKPSSVVLEYFGAPGKLWCLFRRHCVWDELYEQKLQGDEEVTTPCIWSQTSNL